ncbi:MAG TPA: glycosyltransferase family 39 protein [Candidatus Dormibacteraeota bacterium]|nr:glycosyltransferase family 39 protein [Candidatus Dormibacteraeota bacterium]
MSPRTRAALSALLLVAAIAFTYRNSFDGGFVSDDRGAILNNPLLRSLDAANIRAIFSSFDDANYIPLKVLSLAVDQRLWGPAPFGYHLGNILLHIVCALLVWRILLGAGLSDGAAVLVALLWALHPLQVESAAWMSERKNVLSGACFFAAFLAWLHFSASGRWRAYALVLVLFVLALLSKMNTVVLPALCLAYDGLVARRLDRRSLLASLPLFAAGALVVWYNLAGNRIHGSRFHGGTALVTWLTSTTVPFRYLAKVAWPAHLSSYYYVPLYGSPLDPPVALAIAGLLALGALTAWLAARRRPEAFWLLWFIVTLAPMLNIVPFPTLMQDRYMYLPLVGVLAAPALALDAALRAPLARRLAAALAAGAVLACIVVSEQRIAVWHDELSLWRDWALQEWYLPVDIGPQRGPDSDRHLAVLEEAAGRDPGDLVVRQNLGALLYERGDLARATVELEAAQGLAAEDNGVVLMNLGRTYLRSGDPARAAAVLRRSVAAEPYSFYSQLNLARAALALGDRETAAAALAACARIRPGQELQFAAEQRQLGQLESGR